MSARVRRGLFCLLFALLAGAPVARAHPWNSNPQPILQGNDPIRADAGSPLAWDQSAKILWFIDGGDLCAASWTSRGFYKTSGMGLICPKMEGGLLVDSGLHYLFCLNADGMPQWVRWAGNHWVINPMGAEPLTRLLGVDPSKHWLFGYDANAGGIRQYSYDAKAKRWNSTLIATGLGNAGDAGAVDGVSHILYSTHETADASVARYLRVGKIGVPTGPGELRKHWPLVATTWDGKRWTSRVLEDTGVPQQPAVSAIDHRVYYGQRDEPALVHYYQPKVAGRAESFGSNSGWAGTDTFEDNDSYPIVQPVYPSYWWGSYGCVMTMAGGGYGGLYYWKPYTGVALQGPITVIPYYQPVWSDSALPPRLASFRAAVNPKQNRLVQHREIYAGEVARQQTGAQVAGYLYRDANGVLATQSDPNPQTSLSSPWMLRVVSTTGSSSGSGSSSSTSQVSSAPVNCGALDASFDPANPPASFAQLADANVVFYALPENIVSDPAQPGLAKSQAVPSFCSLDPNAPFVPPFLRRPTRVELHTFGHNYLSKAPDQPGGRYRDYSNFGTDYAVPSGIAVDAATGVTFYTQAPPPADDENTAPAPTSSAPSLSGFAPSPDPKLPRPADASVWIVMVY